MTLDDRQLATVLYALRQYEARVSDESERSSAPRSVALCAVLERRRNFLERQRPL